MNVNAKTSLVEFLRGWVLAKTGRRIVWRTASVAADNIASLLAAADEISTPLPGFAFGVGERVEKFTGDYQITGIIRAAVRTNAGHIRYVVEHEPGFLHIYNESNLRPQP